MSAALHSKKIFAGLLLCAGLFALSGSYRVVFASGSEPTSWEETCKALGIPQGVADKISAASASAADWAEFEKKIADYARLAKEGVADVQKLKEKIVALKNGLSGVATQAEVDKINAAIASAELDLKETVLSAWNETGTLPLTPDDVAILGKDFTQSVKGVPPTCSAATTATVCKPTVCVAPDAAKAPAMTAYKDVQAAESALKTASDNYTAALARAGLTEQDVNALLAGPRPFTQQQAALADARAKLANLKLRKAGAIYRAQIAKGALRSQYGDACAKDVPDPALECSASGAADSAKVRFQIAEAVKENAGDMLNATDPRNGVKLAEARRAYAEALKDFRVAQQELAAATQVEQSCGCAAGSVVSKAVDYTERAQSALDELNKLNASGKGPSSVLADSRAYEGLSDGRLIEDLQALADVEKTGVPLTVADEVRLASLGSIQKLLGSAEQAAKAELAAFTAGVPAAQVAESCGLQCGDIIYSAPDNKFVKLGAGPENEVFLNEVQADAAKRLAEESLISNSTLRTLGWGLRIVNGALWIKTAYDAGVYGRATLEQNDYAKNFAEAVKSLEVSIKNSVATTKRLWKVYFEDLSKDAQVCTGGLTARDLRKQLEMYREYIELLIGTYDYALQSFGGFAKAIGGPAIISTQESVDAYAYVLGRVPGSVIRKNINDDLKFTNDFMYQTVWLKNYGPLEDYIKQLQASAPTCPQDQGFIDSCKQAQNPPDCQPAPATPVAGSGSVTCYNFPYNPNTCQPTGHPLPLGEYSSAVCAPNLVCAESCSVTTSGPNAGQIGGDIVQGCRDPIEINRIYNAPGSGSFSFLVAGYSGESNPSNADLANLGRQITDFKNLVLNGQRPNNIVVGNQQGQGASGQSVGFLNSIGNAVKNAASAVGNAVRGAVGAVGGFFGGATPAIAPNTVYNLNMNVTIPAGGLKNLQYKSQVIFDKSGRLAIGTVSPSVNGNGDICFNIVTQGKLGTFNFVDALGKIITPYASPQGTCVQQQPQRRMTVGFRISF